MRIAITLIVASGKHQQCLPQALLQEGLLRQAVRTVPDLEILGPGPEGNLQLLRRFPWHRAGTRVLWAVWRRLPPASRNIVPWAAWSRVADHTISKWLAASDVFHGLMGVTLASLERAKRLGAVTLIDNSTLHPAAFRREALADYAAAGAPPSHIEPVMPLATLRRCERQYKVCDKIIAYSSAAARSFQAYGYGSKVVVVNPGVDHGIFVPAARRQGTFRVCYVGRVQAAKGIHHLIQAWQRLGLRNAELVLAGRVLPEMAGLETVAARAGIRLPGILPPEEVARLLQGADLFVFPSVNEGLSLALLEAMSCGVPVVACRDTGADDCVASGTEGLLVPGRDTDALACAILWCYEHREELGRMGQAARMRVESEFTLSHYVRRLLTLYQSVAS